MFYDLFESASLWGKDLFQHLADIYGRRAKYCVIFISDHYIRKGWTLHELKQAQSASFRLDREYILPLRLDDTTLPGLPSTTGYVDLRSTSLSEVTVLILRKLQLPFQHLTQDVLTSRILDRHLEISPEDIRSGVEIGVILANLQLIWLIDSEEGRSAKRTGINRLLRILKFDGLEKYLDSPNDDIHTLYISVLLAYSLVNLKKHAAIQIAISANRIYLSKRIGDSDRDRKEEDQKQAMKFALESIMDVDSTVVADKDPIFAALCLLSSYGEEDIVRLLNTLCGR